MGRTEPMSSNRRAAQRRFTHKAVHEPSAEERVAMAQNVAAYIGLFGGVRDVIKYAMLNQEDFTAYLESLCTHEPRHMDVNPAIVGYNLNEALKLVIGILENFGANPEQSPCEE
jgi:hypothetical protein